MYRCLHMIFIMHLNVITVPERMKTVIYDVFQQCLHRKIDSYLFLFILDRYIIVSSHESQLSTDSNSLPQWSAPRSQTCHHLACKLQGLCSTKLDCFAHEWSKFAVEHLTAREEDPCLFYPCWINSKFTRGLLLSRDCDVKVEGRRGSVTKRERPVPLCM